LKAALAGLSVMKRMMWHNIKTVLSVVLVSGSLLVAIPAYPTEFYDEGLTRADAVKTERAVESWTRVIRRNPRSYEAYVNRGSAYFLRGHVFRGVMDWNRASELAPVFAYALFTGEFITQSAGRGRLLNYAVSIELDPDRIASVLMIGAMYLDIGQDAKAAELFRKSANLTKNPLLKSELDYWVHLLETDSPHPQ
jgi:tetratricopeptide (TPR) repeat protein